MKHINMYSPNVFTVEETQLQYQGKQFTTNYYYFIIIVQVYSN